MTGPIDIQRALASLGGRPRRPPRASSLVQACRNRETGTLVEVHDLDAPGAPLDRGDGQGTAADRDPRWLTLCVDHGCNVGHYTRADAIAHASLPSGWCEPCRNGKPPNPECGA